MTTAKEPIKLTLKGSHAERGVSLSSFESFIEYFLAALRAFQREQAGVPASKAGTPERAAAVATAFRLVQLEPGSAIATLEPEVVDSLDESVENMFDHEPLQMTNLVSLLDRIEEQVALPPSVADSLSGACRALGNDGSIGVRVPSRAARKGGKEVVIDATALSQLVETETPTTMVTSIAGFLHRLDLEPDKIGVRTTDGIEWACDYPEGLELKILDLVGRVVWATGKGRQRGPNRGTMRIETIESAEAGEQHELFTEEQIPADRLAAQQGIEGPQGLATLGVTEWTDEDDAYLAALTEG